MELAPKFERFLDQFVLGSAVVAGTWYLHRPFLLVYFPNIAPDRASAIQGVQFELELTFLMFIVGSICAGLLLTHTSDVATVALFADESSNEKSGRRHRWWLRQCARVVTFRTLPDPRVRAINRYLASPRRAVFLRMLTDWAYSSEQTLERTNEAVVAHQHIVVHLRTRSAQTKSALDELYAPVTFAAGMFTAACALTLIALMSFWTSGLVENIRPVQPNSVKIGVTVGFYFGAVITGISFRRRFRDFCSNVLTVALHFHTEAKDQFEEEPIHTQRKPTPAQRVEAPEA
jgi:hypothetical protein